MENLPGATHRPTLLSVPGVRAVALPTGVAEVVLQRWHIGAPAAWLRSVEDLAEENVLDEREALAQIDAHRLAGARVLLVSLQSNGGNGEAALAIYNALRRFACAGGIVVVHVTG